ncbi:MAG TPA: InlB B-repeat-containing protein [Bacilli bacterium]|nr:InlB B-repeat-containing protein [Bacilli bacterium]
MKKTVGKIFTGIIACYLIIQGGNLAPGLALESNSDTFYSVYFHDTNLPNIRVREGEPIARPSTPVKAGFDFQGWYEDFALTYPYVFETPVMSNLILYPRWNPSQDSTIGDYYYISQSTNYDLSTAIPLVRDYDAEVLTYKIQVSANNQEEFQIINHLSPHATKWGIDINNSKHVFRRAGSYELIFTPEDFNEYHRNIKLLNLDSSSSIDPNDLITIYDGDETIDYYFLSPYQTETVKAYFWTTSIRLLDMWPGIDMEFLADFESMKMFKITVEKGIFDYVKFSGPEGSPTTPSIDLSNYSNDDLGEKWCFYTKSGNYFAFDYASGNIPENIGKLATYYYEVAVNSPTIYAYAYRGTHENAAWPGVNANYIETLSNGRRIFGITMMEEEFYYIIFHDSSAGLLKTPSLDLRGLPSGVCFKTINNTATSAYTYYLLDAIEEIKYYYASTSLLGIDFYAYFYDGIVLGPTSLTFVEMTNDNKYLYEATITRTFNYVIFRGYDAEGVYHETPEIPLGSHPENTAFYIDGSGYSTFAYEPTITNLTYYFETKNPARIQYAFLRDGAINNGWPGEVMALYDTDIDGVRTYKIEFSSSMWSEIRFVNNNSSIFTEYVNLLDYPTGTIFYEINNEVDGYLFGTERPYTIPDIEYPNTITYFFETQVSAPNYFAYFWRSGTNNVWPGYTMVYEGNFGGFMLYSTEITPDHWYNAIFSSTSSVVKTPTIELRDTAGLWKYPDGTVFYYRGGVVGTYLFGTPRPYSAIRQPLFIPPRELDIESEVR